MATLKTILDAVMGESGFLIPANYVGSTNPDDLQLVALANAASDDIRELGLTGVVRQGSIALTGAGSYALPADFLAYVPDTAWVDSRKVDLPVTPQDWTFLNATGISESDIRARFLSALKTIGDASGDTLTYEYVSAYPWSASGVAKELATADTDDWLLDRRLIQLAVKWRWKKEKGIEDWQVDQQLYQRHVNLLRSRDSGAQAIRFGDACPADNSPYTPLWVT